MSGTSERGFTLIEVVVALIIISVAFTALLDILSNATRKLSHSENTFDNLLVLDRKLKLGDHEGLKIESRSLPDFPRIKEVTYSYDGIYFIRYEIR